LGFEVWAYDDRPYYASKAFLPDASAIICDSFAKLGERLEVGPGDYVAIMTRGHRHDLDCLRFLCEGEKPFYLGMVGSKRRVLAAKEELEKDGPQPLLKDLRAPIGLSVGAVTPEEIAVSTAAQLIEAKRGFEAGKGKKVRIDPCADMRVLEFLAMTEGKGSRAACLTVARTSGSSPREAGAKMILAESGETIGTIGGGCAEAEALSWARDLPPQGFLLRSLDLSGTAGEDGMVCGGSMDILIERID
jgi:xanthine dehydrogenase accessory factor